MYSEISVLTTRFHYVIDVSHLDSLYKGGPYVKQNGMSLHWIIWGSWVKAVPSCPLLQHDYEMKGTFRKAWY